MTAAVLLDHPWPLNADRDPRSPGFGVLMVFARLVSEHGLTVVPFIEPKEFFECNCWSAPRTSGLTALRRTGHQYVRWAGGACQATPDPEPPGLSLSWKCALRDAMADLEDWRNPQIVVSERRRPQWPGTDEVEVYWERCENEPRRGPYERVIAALESYSSHPYALSDFDPWNRERFRATSIRGEQCVLPRPPLINVQAPLDELERSVEEARRMGGYWENAGRFYFIPPDDWQGVRLPKSDWREAPFRAEWLNNRKGPVDYKGRVWVWQETHGGHWDVQTDEDFFRVARTGLRF